MPRTALTASFQHPSFIHADDIMILLMLLHTYRYCLVSTSFLHSWISVTMILSMLLRVLRPCGLLFDGDSLG